MSPVDYRLYLVTDAPAAYPHGLLAGVEAAVVGGATLVQYRPTSGHKREWLAEAQALHALLQTHSVPLIINDHLDLALAVGAEGVHVGQHDLPVEVARRLLGSSRILGLSLTAPEQITAVPDGVVDYFGVGPVFPTQTKTDAAPALGLDGLRRIAAVSSVPVVAIGGIQLSNTEELLAHGAAGVAVVSALSRAPDPTAAARRFRAVLPSRL